MKCWKWIIKWIITIVKTSEYYFVCEVLCPFLDLAVGLPESSSHMWVHFLFKGYRHWEIFQVLIKCLFILNCRHVSSFWDSFCNLRWRIIISKLEKYLINIYEIIMALECLALSPFEITRSIRITSTSTAFLSIC